MKIFGFSSRLFCQDESRGLRSALRRHVRIKTIRWIDDDTAEVHGGYHEHGKSASYNQYRLVRERGQWRVVEDNLLLIS